VRVGSSQPAPHLDHVVFCPDHATGTFRYRL
jgi:hypothetical protein